jgi:FG-GAP-like repeat
VSRLKSISRLFFCLVVALALSPSALTQQRSYRSYQHLSGKGLRNAGTPEEKSPQSRTPMAFRGWKHPGKFGPEYLKHFSRPLARQTRAELFASAAEFENQANRSTPQSQLSVAGLLLRNSLPAGYIPTSVASGDFNGDGKMDFVVANGGDNTLWLYFGNGDGTFSLPIILPITLGQSPVWVAAADLRGIGKTDLVVAESDSNSIGIFLGKGDGTFKESSISLPGSVATLAVGDFNHDGKLDIVVPLDDFDSSTYIVTLPGVGNGTFGSAIVTPTTLYPPGTFWVSSGDLNGDGFPDLVLSSGDPVEINLQVALNNGDGTFTAAGAIEGPYGGQFVSTSIFDADEDGKLDLVIADTYGYVWFDHGNGDGTFAPITSKFGTGDFPFGMGVADVNGDGHLDVITSGYPLLVQSFVGATAGNLTSVLLGDGEGNFGPAAVYRGDVGAFSLAISDFNGDGHPDIVTANQDTDSAVVFLNDGKGGYGEPKGSWIGEIPGSYNAPASDMMSVDVDGDSKPDLVLMEYPGADSYDQLTVLLNEGSGNFSTPIRSDAIQGNGNLPCFGDFVLADFRGTGVPDFLAIGCDASVNEPPYISFAPASGGGHFSAPTVTTPAGAQGVIGVGDFNGDGKLDFITATGGVGQSQLAIQVTAFLGNGDGTFRTGANQVFGNTANYPVAVYVGDFNRDGKLDIVVFLEGNGGWTNAQVYELLGKGDGTFQSAQSLFTDFGPMIVADVNNDGHPDIIESAFDRSTNGMLVPATFSIYLGQADGSFTLANTYTPYPYGSLIPQYDYATSAAQHYAPMIGDFNGDGNIDIAAFQSVDLSPNPISFVQFMLGNGDGTFTPTYTLYDFEKYSIPDLAMDVDGDGRDDMVELDGFNSSFHVIPMITGPSLQLSLGSNPVVGTTGSALVTLAVAATSPTAITLSASDPAINVPPMLTVPTGQASQIFAFNIGPSFNANQVFSLTAQLASQTATAYGTQVGAGSRWFTISMGTVSVIDLAAGQSTQPLDIVAQSINGYGGTINLECVGLPSQIQSQISPVTLPLTPGSSADASVVFSVLQGTALGSYPFTLRGTDGVTNFDVPLTLNVGDFSLTISTPLEQSLPTGSATFTFVLTSIDSYNEGVFLTCTGLPTGATCPSAFGNIPTPGGSITPMPLNIQSLPAGNYPFTVTGTSTPLSHSVSATLQIWDFNGSVSPAAATVEAGGSATFNISVASVNGYSGGVTFWCQTPTSQITCAFNPASPSIPANGTATSTMTVTASSQLSERGRRRSALFPAILALPFGALLIAGSRKRWLKCSLLLLVSGAMISCGGGSSGGGGGGGSGSGQSYSIGVEVVSGGSTKTAGTITLTVK